MVLNILGFYILNKYGCGFLPFILAFICHTIAQVTSSLNVFFFAKFDYYFNLKGQSDWTQHDYGHLSVFKNSNLNRYMHLFFMGFIKGASSQWWNNLHNQVIKNDLIEIIETFIIFS